MPAVRLRAHRPARTPRHRSAPAWPASPKVRAAGPTPSRPRCPCRPRPALGPNRRHHHLVSRPASRLQVRNLLLRRPCPPRHRRPRRPLCLSTSLRRARSTRPPPRRKPRPSRSPSLRPPSTSPRPPGSSRGRAKLAQASASCQSTASRASSRITLSVHLASCSAAPGAAPPLPPTGAGKGSCGATPPGQNTSRS